MAQTEQTTVLIDVEVQASEALKRQQELKASLEALKKTQSETADKTSAEYIRQEAQIKNLNTQILANSKVIQANEQAVQQQLGVLNEEEGAYRRKSDAYLFASQRAKDLAAAYGALDARTIEATRRAKAMADELKEIDSSVGQNQRRVGDYAGELKGLGGVFGQIPGPIGQMAEGVSGATMALKGFNAASPMGWISLIIGVIVNLTDKLKGNKEITEGLAKATGFLNGIFSFFTKTITAAVKGAMDFFGSIKSFPDLMKRVGDGIKENLLNRLEAFSVMGKAIVKILQGDIKEGFKDLGNGFIQANTGITNATDKIGKAVKGMAKDIKDATMGGANLAALEKQFENANRNSQKLQLQYQLQAEKLRQIRDDESKSMSERIAANEQLGATLKRQVNDESNIANMQLRIAQSKTKQNGQTKENLDALAEAETRLIDIKERIAGQESEQLANLNSLRRESAAKQKEILAAQAAAMKESEARGVEHANEQQRLYDEMIAKKQAALDSLNAIKLTLIEEAPEDLGDYTQYLADAEAAKMQIIQSSDLAILAHEEMVLDMKYQAAMANAEKTGHDTAAIEQAYAQSKAQIAQSEISAKMSLASGFASNLSEIFGKQTKVGKMAASAAIAIDTAKGAMAAFTSMQAIPVVGVGLGIAAAGAVIAKGARSIKDVWAVKSGLKGDGGGGGASVPSFGGSGAAASVTGALVARTNGQTQQAATTQAMSEAMQANPQQPVLLTSNLTDVLNNEVQIKSDNSL